MAKGGSGSTSTTAPDPFAQQQYANLIGQAQSIAAQPYQPYYGDRVAGFTADQTAAQNAARNYYSVAQANNAPAMKAYQAAQNQSAPQVKYDPVTGTVGYDNVTAQKAGVQNAQAFTYSPTANLQGQTYQASTGSAALIDPATLQQVAAQQLSSTDLSPYMNPFQRSVIDASLADLERQRLIEQNQNQAAAAKSGAYGGSRHGVVDALANSEALRQAGALSANLNSANFAQAQNAAVGDISRTLQADTTNQAANLQLAGLNQGAQNQFGIANLGFLNSASANNAAAKQAADAANMNALNTAGQFNAGQQQNNSQFNAGAYNAAQQFNAAQANTVGLSNAQNQMAAKQANINTALANAQNALQARTSNAGFTQNNQQQQLQAALGMANIGQNNTNAYGQQIALQSGFGNQQQALNQAGLDQNYADFMALQNYPLQMLGIQQSVLQGLPYGQSATQTGAGGNPIGSAAGGALAGYQLGGPWGALAGGAVGLLGGL